MRSLILALILALLFPISIAPDRPPPKQEVSRHDTHRIIICEATAYTNSLRDTGKWPGDKGYGITFTGTKARAGIVAVDPRIIPLGTKVLIGGKEYMAEDTGSKIKGFKVDIFLESRKECIKYGRKTVIVEIMEMKGVHRDGN